MAWTGGPLIFEMHRADSYQQAGDAERRDRDRRHRVHATSSGLQRVIGGVVVGLLAATGLYFLMAPGPGSVSEARPFEHAERVDGGLRVEWSGSECEAVDPERTEVVEAADEVLVTLFVAVPADCARAAVERTHRLDLDEPVGDRTIADGPCAYPAYLSDGRC